MAQGQEGAPLGRTRRLGRGHESRAGPDAVYQETESRRLRTVNPGSEMCLLSATRLFFVLSLLPGLRMTPGRVSLFEVCSEHVHSRWNIPMVAGSIPITKALILDATF